jgi:hypothetical protein
VAVSFDEAVVVVATAMVVVVVGTAMLFDGRRSDDRAVAATAEECECDCTDEMIADVIFVVLSCSVDDDENNGTLSFFGMLGYGIGC